MPSIKNILHLIAPEYIPIAITGALAGAVLTSNSVPDLSFLIVSLNLTLLVSAFNTYNAIADQEIDKINRPERPISSNEISEKQALLLTAALYLVAILLSFLISIELVTITVLSTIITIAYSHDPPHLRTKFLLGNFAGALFYAILCPLAGWAIYAPASIPIYPMSFLLLLAIGLSITKDFEDVSGDGAHKIPTIPLKLGLNKASYLIMSIVTIAFVFLYFLIAQKHLENKFFTLFAFFPLLIFSLNEFRKKIAPYRKKNVFVKVVFLIIALELTIVGLQLF